MRERDGGRSRDERERERSRQQEQARQQNQSQQQRAGDRAREPLDRARDAAEIQRIADRQRIQEKARNYEWGHTFREHVDVTDKELERRVQTGVNARGEQQKRPPAHATRWQSDAACVVATDHLARSDEYKRLRNEADEHGAEQFAVRQPLSQVLGPNWQSDVHGLSRTSGGGAAPSQWRADSHAVGIFRKQPDGRWHVYSCYPQPTP